jgi:anti-anti-sigma factor
MADIDSADGVLSMSGELDLSTADALTDQGRDAVEHCDGAALLLDLSGVEFIDATGVGALVAIRNAALDHGIDVAVRHPSRSVTRLLTLTDLIDVFVHPSEIDGVLAGGRMQKHSLDALAREQLELAHRSPAHRAATTVVGGHERTLRQTLIALVAETSLDEHDNPGEATVFVLRGRVELIVDGGSWEARAGDLVEIPPVRHTLRAHDDSAVLLSAVPRAHVAAPAG